MRILQRVLKMTTIKPTIGGLLSGGMGADPGMLREEGLILRGARASKTSNLGTLRNVGGMLTTEDLFCHTPYSLKALRILQEDPLDLATLEKLPADKITKERDSAPWSKHLLILEGFQVLETCLQNPSYARSICGKYTAVWKDVDETEEKSIARAIFDLRRLNLVSTKDGVAFDLLAAFNMVPLLMGVNTGRTTYSIVHADVSNMYYQLPVGEKLGRRCLFRFGEKYMQARALPMGFKKSCGIAQGISMGLILRTEKGDRDLGIPIAALQQDRAPGYVLLNNGGLIFLVYDSILIICPKDDEREWQRRLRRNFETRAHLYFKYCDIAKEDEVVPYCGLELRRAKKGLQWRVGDQSIATWKVLRGLSLRPTPRTLFRIVSYTRFAAAIQGIPRHKLGKASKMQSELGLITNWDAECLTSKQIDEAWRVFDSILIEREVSKSYAWRHKKSHLGSRSQNSEDVEFIVVAVDATPWRWAVNVSLGGQAFESGASGIFATEAPIAEAESRSSKEGILLAIQRGCRIVIMCNDHRSVGRSYWKGYSTNDIIDKDIRTALDALGTEALICVDVPSKENFADIDSRPEDDYTPEEIEHRHRNTMRRGMEALEQWRFTAKDHFSREELEEDPQEVEEYDSEADSC